MAGQAFRCALNPYTSPMCPGADSFMGVPPRGYLQAKFLRLIYLRFSQICKIVIAKGLRVKSSFQRSYGRSLGESGKPRRVAGAFFDSISILLERGKLIGHLFDGKIPFVMCG